MMNQRICSICSARIELVRLPCGCPQPVACHGLNVRVGCTYWPPQAGDQQGWGSSHSGDTLCGQDTPEIKTRQNFTY